MRMLILMVVLFAGAAFAVEPDMELERYWFTLRQIHYSPHAAKILQAAQVSDDGAEALKAYIAQALSDLDESVKEDRANVCKKRESLKNSAFSFGVELKRNNGNFDAARRGYVKNLGVILNDADERAFRSWVEQQDYPGIGESHDIDASLASGQITPTAALSYMCDSKEQVK